MLDHVGFAVSDLERARKFYQQTLSPLGIMLIYDITVEQTDGEAYLGFGEDQKPYFWVGTAGASAATSMSPFSPRHATSSIASTRQGSGPAARTMARRG
jgi:catechol 2,3-dioxygenase-like lactoylglutathione lyase family enzyme